jgi:hypothetical protein
MPEWKTDATVKAAGQSSGPLSNLIAVDGHPIRSRYPDVLRKPCSFGIPHQMYTLIIIARGVSRSK